MKILRRPNRGKWPGLLALCTQISILVSVSGEVAQRANLKVHCNIYSLGATYPDTLTEIEIGVHSASRPLPLDRHPACLCLGGVKFSLEMGGPRFKVHFPPAKMLSNSFFGLIFHKY